MNEIRLKNISHHHYYSFKCLVALGLCCCTWAFSSCGAWRLLSSSGAWAFRCGGFSCCSTQVLECAGFSSCGTWGSAVVTHGLSWNLAGPGIRPVSPALVGGILTTRTTREVPSPSSLVLIKSDPHKKDKLLHVVDLLGVSR